MEPAERIKAELDRVREVIAQAIKVSTQTDPIFRCVEPPGYLESLKTLLKIVNVDELSEDTVDEETQ